MATVSFGDIYSKANGSTPGSATSFATMSSLSYFEGPNGNNTISYNAWGRNGNTSAGDRIYNLTPASSDFKFGAFSSGSVAPTNVKDYFYDGTEFIKSNIKLANLSINSNKIPPEQTIINNKTNKINNKQYNKQCDIESQYRCNARIWNNIYDRITLKEVIDVDKKFKVKDFIDINIKEFHSKYIVGTQCRKGKNTEDSIYCHQHKKHCIHGNYFEIPTQELCLHYMKDGNYL